MSMGGKRAYLSRALDSHIRSIQESFQMLDRSADSSLEKVEWSQVTKLGDEISKQSTIAGMLWSGETPGVKEVEENMGAYCNMLHGFILLCHGSTVGAGPSLHTSIRTSAKQVIDCSISLLREAVSSGEPHNSGKRLSIPQLSGSVWEACATFKKAPTTNYTAIGRAMTQVAVSIKDVLREMQELKHAAHKDLIDGTSNTTHESHDEDSSSEADLDDDLSPEEMNIARLVITVVSDTLIVVKETIRFITRLLKSSDQEHYNADYINALEKLLSCCQDMGDQVNDLGASVYPPQEISQMKSSAKQMHRAVGEMRTQVGSIGGEHEGLLGVFEGLESSLGKLKSELSGDLVPEMKSLTI